LGKAIWHAGVSTIDCAAAAAAAAAAAVLTNITVFFTRSILDVR